ncbi:MAG: hypothetical protein HY396_02570 [Candidatus Doudnabacteria bacterium]|nr:hypothetical protein [Candidatus Doudnabacteria bacterium]
MSLIVFLVGLLLAIFSHPKVTRFFMSRLFNEGVITPRRVSPEKAEMIKYAGPNLSLFAIGIILMMLAVILRNS